MKDLGKIIWECTSCGHSQPKWTGNCSECNSWNSFVQQVAFEKKKTRFEAQKTESAKPMSIKDVQIGALPRIYSGIKEIDRLFGGGIVPGSLILVGGEPGVGKSTLLLQLASCFAKEGKKVLYVCGEESVEQTTLRARRLHIADDHLYLLHETLFSAVKAQVDILQPEILIIDSVQILYKAEVPSAPGSVVQVREVATECMHLAKGCGITTFLIGHVTKSGELAGPRVLEHIVDTVLEFEGDRQQGFRLLRSMKNRFGPTDELAIFRMTEKGLDEVINPSLVFLEERSKNVSGSVVVPTMEGGRTILVEVQSLVTSSVFPSPSRKCTGIDQNRLALLLAVLEKRLHYQMYKYDVFVSVVGGVKIVEPALDLGILLSLASSYANVVVDEKTIVFGEVGLGGEIRAIRRMESRIKEAALMGFQKCLLPKKNLREVSKELQEKICCIGVDVVDEAIDALL